MMAYWLRNICIKWHPNTISKYLPNWITWQGTFCAYIDKFRTAFDQFNHKIYEPHIDTWNASIATAGTYGDLDEFLDSDISVKNELDDLSQSLATIQAFNTDLTYISKNLHARPLNMDTHLATHIKLVESMSSTWIESVQQQKTLNFFRKISNVNWRIYWWHFFETCINV